MAPNRGQENRPAEASAAEPAADVAAAAEAQELLAERDHDSRRTGWAFAKPALEVSPAALEDSGRSTTLVYNLNQRSILHINDGPGSSTTGRDSFAVTRWVACANQTWTTISFPHQLPTLSPIPFRSVKGPLKWRPLGINPRSAPRICTTSSRVIPISMRSYAVCRLIGIRPGSGHKT